MLLRRDAEPFVMVKWVRRWRRECRRLTAVVTKRDIGREDSIEQVVLTYGSNHG
jgi:hypothetical protein